MRPAIVPGSLPPHGCDAGVSTSSLSPLPHWTAHACYRVVKHRRGARLPDRGMLRVWNESTSDSALLNFGFSPSTIEMTSSSMGSCRCVSSCCRIFILHAQARGRESQGRRPRRRRPLCRARPLRCWPGSKRPKKTHRKRVKLRRKTAIGVLTITAPSVPLTTIVAAVICVTSCSLPFSRIKPPSIPSRG